MIAWILPLILLLVLAPFSYQIDLGLAKSLYWEEFWNPSFFKLLYNYGYYPANTIGIGSLILFAFSFFIKSLIPYRRILIYLALVLGLGAGAIVHGVFKDHWGRPRPRQITEFGGTYDYQPFWKPNFHAVGSTQSFVSGHAATGFYFFALAVIAWHFGRKRAAVLWFLVALILGFTIGIARMSQGGHFFTDVVGAGVIMWYTCLILRPILPKKLL